MEIKNVKKLQLVQRFILRDSRDVPDTQLRITRYHLSKLLVSPWYGGASKMLLMMRQIPSVWQHGVTDVRRRLANVCHMYHEASLNRVRQQQM